MRISTTASMWKRSYPGSIKVVVESRPTSPFVADGRAWSSLWYAHDEIFAASENMRVTTRMRMNGLRRTMWMLAAMVLLAGVGTEGQETERPDLTKLFEKHDVMIPVR